jgi:hypothetical protein
MKSNHIVLTTIYEPCILFSIRKNLKQHGHLDDTVCWVVGDCKTPACCADFCQQVSALGLETHYLDIETQDNWGKQFQEFYGRIPYNNETRRNIGYLYALEHGCERLISMDDDNYPTDDDLVGCHLKTGSPWQNEVIEEVSGYYNICEHLTIFPDRQIFPRGFPFELRDKKNSCKSIIAEPEAHIGVTSGLWTREPDVDVTTWLNGKIESTGYNGPDSLVLSQETWSPVNTQNTSVTRELVPAFLCVPMGYPVSGGRIERYGDIWGGYFLQALMAGSAYHVCFGRPIVEHCRNPHNYLDDLRHEFWGMILTDWLLSVLRGQFRPEGADIIERIEQLSVFLHEVNCRMLPKWCPKEVSSFVSETAQTLSKWAKVCGRIVGRFQSVAA